LEVGRVVIGQKIKMGGKEIFHKIPFKKNWKAVSFLKTAIFIIK
jgi:hypothetical protein